MVNKRFWLGILVMVLVFGMTAVGCDNGNGENGGNTGGTGGESNTDSALNGIWTPITNIFAEHENLDYELQIMNGNWETKYFGSSDEKGTVNNGIATITHIHGDTCTRYLPASNFEFESKWYSKDELQALNVDVKKYFESFNYSVEGNTLTWGSAIYTAVYPLH